MSGKASVKTKNGSPLFNSNSTRPPSRGNWKTTQWSYLGTSSYWRRGMVHMERNMIDRMTDTLCSPLLSRALPVLSEGVSSNSGWKSMSNMKGVDTRHWVNAPQRLLRLWRSLRWNLVDNAIGGSEECKDVRNKVTLRRLFQPCTSLERSGFLGHLYWVSARFKNQDTKLAYLLTRRQLRAMQGQGLEWGLYAGHGNTIENERRTCTIWGTRYVG